MTGLTLMSIIPDLLTAWASERICQNHSGVQKKENDKTYSGISTLLYKTE